MHPIGCGLFLLFVALVGLLGWNAYRTAADFVSRRAGAGWWAALCCLFAAGCVAGGWLGLFFHYPLSGDVVIWGFPVPVGVWQREDGDWVDYVPPPPLSLALALLNALLIAFGSVLPVSLARAIGKRLVKCSARPGPWLPPPSPTSRSGP